MRTWLNPFLGLLGAVLLAGCSTAPIFLLGPEGQSDQCRFDRSKSYFQAREDQHRCVVNLQSKGFREVDAETAIRAKLTKSIGKLKFDDFLANWGPPTSSSQGDSIFVATWRHEEDSITTVFNSPFEDPMIDPFYDPFYDPAYNPVYNPGYPVGPVPFSGGDPAMGDSETVRVSHGREVRLTFDKATGLLKKWHYKKW